MHTYTSQRGVTLLLSVLFLAAGLSISLGIFYIVFVQLQINRAARDSHIAFYAADTGKECAAFYREYIGDVANRGFWSPTSPCDGPADGSGCVDAAKIPVCAGLRVRKWVGGNGTIGPAGVDYSPGTAPVPPDPFGNPPDVEGVPHIFKFSTDPATGLCVDVEIEVLERRVATQPDTRIITRVDGFSACPPKQNIINQSFNECKSAIGGGCAL